jgi:hypothetical protein
MFAASVCCICSSLSSLSWPSSLAHLQVQARYSYIYRKIDGVWKIAEHHSSAMPEPVAAPAEAAKEAVGELSPLLLSLCH